MERTRDSEISKTEYEVFLSFRGPDTRQGFTDVLYDHLKEGGIQVFRDDDELAVGDNIELILDAVKNSKICVPIFSKSFASSAWCLREVAKMVELNKDIAPIFYDVTPDDVKLKTPLYVDQLREHEKKYGREQAVEKWEEALVEVGRIKGRELKETGFVEFSKKLREEIWFKLRVKQKYTINHLVEMTDEIEEALKLLDIESTDVRLLGMHGMGGIGKTTLAKIIFNRISTNFEACSFLANVQEDHSQNGVEYLQKKLLEDLNPKAASDRITADWVERVKKPLRMKRVLIVLDDVGERSHITELVRDSISFGLGSRIIITTRDERVLMNVEQVSSSNEGNDRVIRTMQIKGMNREQALKLFSRHAFRRDSPPQDYTSLSEDVVSSSGGLPLALKVIGSLLCGMSLEAWKDKIRKLKTIPAVQVQEKLMISYEALEDDAKEIFLDIACFFIGKEKSNPIYMWEGCGFGPNWAVPVLISMSLIRITDDDKFWMHDQLRDLGREIVRTKGYNGSCSREGSRIQTYEDALYVLDMKKEKEVVGIPLDGSSDTPTNFSSYGSLRFLQVRGGTAIPVGNFWQLPKNLRWLSLCLDYPNLTASIRSKFPTVIRSRNSRSSNLMKLAGLDLSFSSITDYWEGWILLQELQSLKVLNLTWCDKLTRTPNFSKMVALETLILRGCKRLAKIHSSIGKLRKLKYLDLEGCDRLRELPEEVGNLEDLKHLSLTKCRELKKLPESIGDLRSSLVHLNISSSESLEELPASIGRLAKLEHLSLSRCSRIKKLPDSIVDLTLMVSLNLSRCSLIEELPSSITRLVKLERLSLWKCKKIVKLPDDIGNLESLVELNLWESGVAALPNSVGDIGRLEVMNLRGTDVKTLPETVAQLSLLRKLDLSHCHRIGRLPELPTSLTDLYLEGCPLKQAPDLSKLIRLTVLTLDNVREVHLECSALRQLKFLVLGCQNLKCVIPQFPSSLQHLELQRVESETKLPCLSNLNNLSQLKFNHCWKERGLIRSLGVDRLESLTTLTINLCGKIPDLSQLKCLQELEVKFCRDLVEIPGLGTLVSLKGLVIQECGSLKRLENIKNLTRLTIIGIWNCKNLRRIEGLEELHVCFVFINGCKCKNIYIDDMTFNIPLNQYI